MKHTAIVFQDGKKKELTVCCADFSKATKMGTGHDGHKPAIQRKDKQWIAGGDRLPVIVYCPWCGESVEG